VKHGIRVAWVFVSCGFLSCAAVLGFANRTGTWCTQRTHTFCEDFDDPSLLAQNWPLSPPPHLIPTFEGGSLPNAAEFSIFHAGVSPTRELFANPGTAFIQKVLPPNLFTSHKKLAFELEAQLVGFDASAATFDGASPFAPLLILAFEEPNGTKVYGGVVLEQAEAGSFWQAAGIQLTVPPDAAGTAITVNPASGPCLEPGRNHVCTCIELSLGEGSLNTMGSYPVGITIPPLPNQSPSYVFVGLVEAPVGTSVAIDNVTIDYDQDCDPSCAMPSCTL
jgi:hypothetical protein